MFNFRSFDDTKIEVLLRRLSEACESRESQRELWIAISPHLCVRDRELTHPRRRFPDVGELPRREYSRYHGNGSITDGYASRNSKESPVGAFTVLEQLLVLSALPPQCTGRLRQSVYECADTERTKNRADSRSVLDPE